MAKRPTKLDIQLWIPAATDIFNSIMPPIDAPYPQVVIVNSRNFRTISTQLIQDLGCKATKIAEDCVMQYMIGDKGRAMNIAPQLNTLAV